MKWIVAALVIWAAWRWLRPKPRARTRTVRDPVRDEAEARAVLGVPPDADADAIRAAHRRLLAEAHPDRGGDEARAARINAARDHLLALSRARERVG